MIVSCPLHIQPKLLVLCALLVSIVTACTSEQIATRPAEVSVIAPTIQTPSQDMLSTSPTLVSTASATRPAKTRTSTPTPRPTQTKVPSATINVTEYIGVSQVYTNTDLGLAFGYPAIYDESSLTTCAPHINEGYPNTVYVGVRVHIDVYENTNALGLRDYVDNLFAKQPDLEVQTLEDDVVNSHPAIYVLYMAGSRTTEARFLAQGHRVYAIVLTWGPGTCDGIFDDRIREDSGLYFQVLQSFQLLNQ